jgi:CubicO group peptidase (beta-lactamase class C family)
MLGLGAGLAPSLAFARDREEFWPQTARLIGDLVGTGKVPCAVVAIGTGGNAPRFHARGTLAFDSPELAGPDSLFRIYSMSKPVTGMAAMILIAQGRLGLDQPVADLLPRYRTMQVLDDPDGPLDRVRPAQSPMTIRQLMTHTAGLGYSITQTGPLRQAFNAAGLAGGRVSRRPLPGAGEFKEAHSLEVFADRLAELPLAYQPGSKWSYSFGLDLLGRVIEVASGRPFERFLHEEIFGPAGMTSTWFQVPARAAQRLTTNYGVDASGVHPIDPGAKSVYLDPALVPSGGGGLISTARDYDRFLQVLAGNGRIGRRLVMPSAAVRQGLSNLLPPQADIAGSWAEGAGHGAGGIAGIGDKAGVFYWSGAASTVFRLDWKRGIRAGFYMQAMPTSVYKAYDTFPRAIASDLGAMQLI